MIHVIFIAILAFFLVQMIYLPPKAYKKLLCDFAEIEERRMVRHFCFTDTLDKELDSFSDQLLDTINAPCIFFAKKMQVWFIGCLVVLSLYLFVVWKVDLLTVIDIRVICSSTVAVCLLVYSVHLFRIDIYKKDAKKDIDQLFLDKQKEEQEALALFLKKTSSVDYDTPES